MGQLNHTTIHFFAWDNVFCVAQTKWTSQLKEFANSLGLSSTAKKSKPRHTHDTFNVTILYERQFILFFISCYCYSLKNAFVIEFKPFCTFQFVLGGQTLLTLCYLAAVCTIWGTNCNQRCNQFQIPKVHLIFNKSKRKKILVYKVLV